MKHLLGGLAVAFAVFLPVPVAHAADFNTFDWSQFHFGIGVGYGAANHELNIEDDSSSIELSGIGGEGWLGTIEAGYDYEMDGFVIGAAVDYTRSNIAAELDISDGVDSLDVDVEATDSASAIVRAGFLVSDIALIYGLGGWTQTWWNTDASLNGASIDGNDFDFDLGGVTFGGGVETLLLGDVSLKLEYRYVDYESLDVLDLIGITPPPGVSVDLHPNVQSVRAVLSYRF